MLRFVPPAGTPLEITEILRGAKAALFPAAGLDRSLSSLAEQVHAASVVATCSGRAALWLVLKALHRLRPDRNVVILPAYTCFTVPASAVRAGLKVHPVDINPETLDFDFARLERVPSGGLLCVITSNLCGMPNDVERVREIAQAKGAFVVDDAAQAMGASCDGSRAGLRGDAGIFSFGRGKALAAMEGGLAVTGSSDIAAAIGREAERVPKTSAAHSVRLLGEMLVYAGFLKPRRYWMPNSVPFLGLGATEFDPGFPIARMAGLTMGLLAQMLPKLDEINAARARIANSIANALAGYPAFTIPKPNLRARPVYTRLPVITSDASIRDRSVARLRAAGIGASPFYPGAICDIPGLKPYLAPGFTHCPVSESLAARLFTLPTHAYVDEQDITRMVETLAGTGWRFGTRDSGEGALVSSQSAVASRQSPVDPESQISSSEPAFPGTGARIPSPEPRAPDGHFASRSSLVTHSTSGRQAALDSDSRTPNTKYRSPEERFIHHSSLVSHHSTNSRQSPVDPGSQISSSKPTFPGAGARIPSPESRAKRLLLIAFDFPPRRTSGIYRPTGLTKYLARLGWQTTVLTVNADAKDLQDPVLLKRVPPQTEVVRTRYFNFMAWEDSTAGAVRNLGALNPSDSPRKRRLIDPCLRRLATWVRSCLYFPDRTSGWVPFGLAKAIQLVHRERFDVIYSTSPPRSSLVIGLSLRILLRAPWVAEFRDPWCPPEGKVRRWAERRLLSMIAHRADAVVVVTSGQANEFSTLGIPASKIKVIPNGFDEDDFRPDHSSPTKGNGLLKPGYFHFTHLGTIYPNDSGKFFEALRDFVHEFPDCANKMRINIVGYPDEVAQHYADDEALHPLVKIHGFVDHRYSIELMRLSHCLLLFRANRDFAHLCVGGKTYEYLRSGRPILAITYNGPTKTLIQEGRAGWVIHPDDKHGIKEALHNIVTGGSGVAAKHTASEAFAAQFRYDHLAVRMAAVFDGIAGQS